jgi:hypothetical protein
VIDDDVIWQPVQSRLATSHAARVCKVVENRGHGVGKGLMRGRHEDERRMKREDKAKRAAEGRGRDPLVHARPLLYPIAL